MRWNIRCQMHTQQQQQQKLLLEERQKSNSSPQLTHVRNI